MYIEIYSTHNELVSGQLKNKNVVIIDVLRATSVIVTALENGARKVKTSISIDNAFEQKSKETTLLLGGERNAVKIKGFDFGNSPLEYTKEKIKNKTILLTTTNGTQSVNKSSGAKTLIAASFLNLNSVLEYLVKINEDFHIICSGTQGKFSLDDGLCAGLILHELRKRSAVSSSDFGELLTLPFKEDSFSIQMLLSKAYHLNFLKSRGLSADIDYCLQINKFALIPIWKVDGFVALKE